MARHTPGPAVPQHIAEIPDGHVSTFYPSVLESTIYGWTKIGFKNTGEVIMVGTDGAHYSAILTKDHAESLFIDALEGRHNFVWAELCRMSQGR